MNGYKKKLSCLYIWEKQVIHEQFIKKKKKKVIHEQTQELVQQENEPILNL